ncbi:hypothetical protein F2Q69_00036038 [Brassica cretica]|uniref:Uncharacterized protein n=1 Tax=Brassica cretica TaxID=69181 RepID=A0A8S9SPM5_BRACR|nr:hypothetical protein F2Q69_00036038 [Brassica cretica]
MAESAVLPAQPDAFLAPEKIPQSLRSPTIEIHDNINIARDSLHLSNPIRRRSSLFRPSLPALSLAPPAKSIPLTVFRPAPPPLSQPDHPRISSLSRWSIQINLVFSKR